MATPTQPETSSRRVGVWARASALAGSTPESRNRYVDFLRALSIAAVIVGHWLIAAPYMSGGELAVSNLLGVQPSMQWLTWGFQVMPIFFLVGGYSNAASWVAARRSGMRYGEWLGTRLRRLVGPVLPLLAVWSGIALVAHAFGVAHERVSLISQLALVPIWFLAVYVGVAVLVPWTHAAWCRFGFASLAALLTAAIAVDGLALGLGLGGVGWANYAFVWIGIHQLGYAWRDAALGRGLAALGWGLGGLAAAIALVVLGPYPLSMVGVPGQEVGNTLPPTLALLALGVFQSGLVIALEWPARRWLARSRAWTLAVLTNGMIMTVYLWHLSAMIALVALGAYGLGGLGLELEPGGGLWWATRPVWLALLFGTLLLFVALFARFERAGPRATRAQFSTWRGVVGAGLICPGLALLAYGGIGSAAFAGLRLEAVALPFVGAALVRFGPLARLSNALVRSGPARASRL